MTQLDGTAGTMSRSTTVPYAYRDNLRRCIEINLKSPSQG